VLTYAITVYIQHFDSFREFGEFDRIVTLPIVIFVYFPRETGINQAQCVCVGAQVV